MVVDVAIQTAVACFVQESHSCIGLGDAVVQCDFICEAEAVKPLATADGIEAADHSGGKEDIEAVN